MPATQMITTKGLVINERAVGEADKYIDILTEDFGVIEVSVKGAKKLTSKSSGSSQLFSYSKLCLSKRGERYFLNSSELISIFYEIRLSVENLSLAAYFSELIKHTIPFGQPCKDILRLFLNTLHFICKGKKSISQLKSIFELRLMSEIGLMPQLVGCSSCFTYQTDIMFFDLKNSSLICKKCYLPSKSQLIKLPFACVQAMRHICLSEIDKIFSFSLSDQELMILGDLSEKYTINQLERRFNTLSFYKKIIGGLNE